LRQVNRMLDSPFEMPIEINDLLKNVQAANPEPL
jgi:hypothetical protein